MRYELTNETKEIEVDGTTHTLHRIRALKKFNCQGRKVKVGDLGGFVETKRNLSQAQNSTAWVFDNAFVYGNTTVCDNATVYGSATVYDNAKVCNNAMVCGDATVCGSATVCDIATVYGSVTVCDNAKVYGFATVCDNAKVCGDADISCSKDIYYDDANDITYMKGRNGILISSVAFDDFIKTVKANN